MSHASRPNGSSVTERASRKAVLLMRTEDLQLQRGSRRPALRSDYGPSLFCTHTFHRRNIIGSPSAFFFFCSSSVLSPPPASHSHTPLAGAERYSCRTRWRAAADLEVATGPTASDAVQPRAPSEWEQNLAHGTHPTRITALFISLQICRQEMRCLTPTPQPPPPPPPTHRLLRCSSTGIRRMLRHLLHSINKQERNLCMRSLRWRRKYLK